LTGEGFTDMLAFMSLQRSGCVQPPRVLESLPDVPHLDIVVKNDRSAEAKATGGYFDVHRLDLAVRYSDGTHSPLFTYDVGAREAIDGVIILACFVKNGVRHVFLRSSLRPPCALRPVPPGHGGGLWELPAGLIDPGEDPIDAVRRELMEELGFSATAAQIHPLGEWVFSAPAIIGERQLFYVVDVDPAKRMRPTEDGSVLEQHAAILSLPVEDAVEHCRRGAIRDSKTEMGLRRLAERPVEHDEGGAS
jgi:ADP-ribose pyrophosphatase